MVLIPKAQEMKQAADWGHRVANDPRYRDLVRRRTRLGTALSLAMFFAYLGFISLVAFGKPLLARPLTGGATTVGIPIGMGVILLAIILTGIYVRRSSRDFDGEIALLAQEFRT